MFEYKVHDDETGLLSASFEQSPDALMLVQREPDGGFRCLRVNHSFAKATGFAQDAVEGMRVDDLLPIEDAQRLINEYQRCLERNDTIEFVQNHEVPKGKLTWHVSLRPLEVLGKEVLIVAARDITWSQNFSQQLNMVANHIPGFVYQLCLTPEGHWHYPFVGARAEEMFGVSVSEAKQDATALLDLIHPQDIDRVVEESMCSAKNLTPWNSEFRIYHRNGQMLWVEAYDLPQRFEDGTILWTGYVNDITERKALEASLKDSEARYRQLANYDQVTGLANRSGFLSQLKQALSLAEMQDSSLALLFIDLDQFKSVNDTFGHYFGDALLLQFAERLSGQVRSTDLVARIGGDEFVVLLQCPIDTEAALHVAQKLVSVSKNAFQIDGYNIEVSASIGVAIYPEHGTSIESLMQVADEAMYRAKASDQNVALVCNAANMSSRSVLNVSRLRTL